MPCGRLLPKLVACDAGRIRSPAVGNRHTGGSEFVSALFVCGIENRVDGMDAHVVVKLPGVGFLDQSTHGQSFAVQRNLCTQRVVSARSCRYRRRKGDG